MPSAGAVRTVTDDQAASDGAGLAEHAPRRRAFTSAKHLKAVYTGLSFLEQGRHRAHPNAQPPPIVQSTLSFLTKMKAHRAKHADYRCFPGCSGCLGICAIKSYSLWKLAQARDTGDASYIRSAERIVRSIDA